MAEQLPSNKLQVVFLINNYHEVMYSFVKRNSFAITPPEEIATKLVRMSLWFFSQHCLPISSTLRRTTVKAHPYGTAMSVFLCAFQSSHELRKKMRDGLASYHD